MKTMMLAAFAATLATAPAAATVKVATYTGLVVSGWDDTGVFGAAGTDLAGAPYVARYRYDTNVGIRNTLLPYYDGVYGGTPASPILDAALTINGVTQHIPGITYGGAVVRQLWQTSDHYAARDTDDGSVKEYWDLRNYASSVATPLTLDDSMPLTIGNGDGYFIFSTLDYTTGKGLYAEGFLGLGPVSVQIGNAVPEPAAWAMLVAGFGLTGAGLRRRRPVAA